MSMELELRIPERDFKIFFVTKYTKSISISRIDKMSEYYCNDLIEKYEGVCQGAGLLNDENSAVLIK